MVHCCTVPGYTNRSNKLECKGIKFYTLLKAKNFFFLTWLSLVGCRFSEISLHSRVCSQHFAGGIKKKNSVPQIFPWQKRSATTSKSVSTFTHALSPSNIVYHDHSYFAQPSHLPSTYVSNNAYWIFYSLVFIYTWCKHKNKYITLLYRGYCRW